jgi:hypothetical protein
MGNFTPKPQSKHTKIKFTSKGEKLKKDIALNDEVPVTENKYSKPNIRNKAPN